MAKGLPGFRPCCVQDCLGNSHYSAWGKRGYCAKHYARIQRRGTLEVSRAPAGTGAISRGGYRILYVDGKRTPEHRVVMERHLGRELSSFPIEVIHHINGNKLDNDIDNLVVVSQSEHMTFWEQRRYGTAYEKECSKCGEVLPVGRFSNRGRGDSLRRADCKTCQAAYNTALNRRRRIAKSPL